MFGSSIFELTGNKQGNQRNEFIDFIRGTAMIFVLFHHASVPLSQYILAFHMPLFFIISGYMEYYIGRKRDIGFRQFAKKKFIRLMVPYYCFEIVNLLLWYVICIIRQTSLPVGHAAYSILTCINTEGYSGLYGRLWFLPCMFVSSLLFYGTIKICKEKAYFVIAMLVSLLAWIMTQKMPFRLPMTIDTAVSALFFMIIGYFFGDAIGYCLENKSILKDALITVLCVITLYISVANGGNILMYENRYGEFAYSIIGALAGSFAFFVCIKYVYWAFMKFPFGKKIVLWYGRNSLAVFPVHLQIKMGIIYLQVKYLRPWPVMLLIMLTLSIPIVNVVRNALPIMTGDKRQK